MLCEERQFIPTNQLTSSKGIIKLPNKHEGEGRQWGALQWTEIPSSLKLTQG